MALADEEPRAGVTQPSSRPRRTSTPSGATPSAARRASTCPATRAAPGADPGLRTALGEQALLLDVPADIQGIDLGPSPTPYQRAEKLAAEAHGAARSWFLTNGARQGNHALHARARAARRARRRAAQLARQRRRRPGAVRRRADLRRAGVRGRARDGARRHARVARARRSRPRARRAPSSSSRRPTTGWPPTWRAARRSATPRACRWSSTRRGGRTSASTRTCRRARLQHGADAVLTSTHKIVGSLTQSAMLHVGPSGRVDPERVARMVRLDALDLAVGAADGLARRRAAPARGPRRGAARVARWRPATPRGRRSTPSPARAWSATSSSARPGVAGWDPMRIVIDVRGTGCTGYEVAAGLREGFDIHVELATHATMVLILGLGQPRRGPRALRARLRPSCGGCSRPGEAAALVRAPGALENEVVVPPREAFLGDARARGGRRRDRPRLRRGDRRLPAGHPRAAAGRADHDRGRRLPARAQGLRRAPARRERPAFAAIHVLARPDGSAAARAASCVPCAPYSIATALALAVAAAAAGQASPGFTVAVAQHDLRRSSATRWPARARGSTAPSRYITAGGIYDGVGVVRLGRTGKARLHRRRERPAQLHRRLTTARTFRARSAPVLAYGDVFERRRVPLQEP